jgi:hypothetical protein
VLPRQCDGQVPDPVLLRGSDRCPGIYLADARKVGATVLQTVRLGRLLLGPPRFSSVASGRASRSWA